ncbi:MAG: hypothetical protein GC190_21755 [Alphaproteobacteria bacterium]|nr:hypothetical protein [Alphaproteobacteria bacterium]
MTRFVLVPLLAVGLSACSAEIATTGLPSDPKPNTEVNGVPYRVREPYVVELYRKTDKGYVRVNEDQTQALANPDRLYLLEHKGQLFSDSDTKFTLRDDGSLATVHLNSKTHAPEAISTAGTELTAIQKVEETRRAAQNAAQASAEQSELDYVTAIGAVRVAEAKLSALPSTANVADRVAAENEVVQAKVRANIAARKAGVGRPYPNIGL